jgi:hypothetical protein
LASFRTAQGKLLNLAAERTTSVRHILGNNIVLPHPSVSKHTLSSRSKADIFSSVTWISPMAPGSGSEELRRFNSRTAIGSALAVELTFAGTAGASGAKQALARKCHRLIKAAATACCTLLAELRRYATGAETLPRKQQIYAGERNLRDI